MALSGNTLTSLQPMKRSPSPELVQAGISRNFASLPDGCGIMWAIFGGAAMSERNASPSASISAS